MTKILWIIISLVILACYLSLHISKTFSSYEIMNSTHVPIIRKLEIPSIPNPRKRKYWDTLPKKEYEV